MFDFLQDLDNDIRNALLAQLRNFWAHTSTAIEGNTLTLGETAFVLEEGLTISGKPLKDHEEVVGHARAIDLVYDLIRRKSDLTENDLFDLHKAVQTERVIDVYKPVGAWKAEPNSTVIVSGGTQVIFEFASPKDVPELMQSWLALFQKTCREDAANKEAANKEAALTAYVYLHVSFVRIHPFWDGNGWMARLIANIPVIKAGYPPIIIPRECRQEYIEALSEYHLLVGTVTARSELLPDIDKLDRFKRFCAESWSGSIKLVGDAQRVQQERNQEKNTFSNHMTKKYYAHTLEGKPPSDWQPLEEHLKNVAEMASSFADAYGAGEWGYLAGLWHDIGKYSDEFQKMLGAEEGNDAHIETKPGRVDHSTAGAQHAFKLLKDKGKILAYAIAGHHAGLPDGKSNNDSCLIKRLEKRIPNYSSCQDQIFNISTLNDLPFALDQKRFGFQLSFFIRMIFSSLVDADFLDTETFMDSEKSLWRKGYSDLSEMDNRLTSALNELIGSASDTLINEHRTKILKNCLDAAESPQGLFSLTVPTGGGKTLSSLAFAIKHALKHGLERIIYVIPYTSIIEQNAAVFRKILGENAVLEHHSNFEPKEEDHRSRLAAENWDAPLIVTTNVQFFESLYRCRSSRCRKIHNIAKSVVILDEAQMLPVPLLRPCMEVLRELSSTYRTTIVLCTATQPALSTNENFKDGLDGVREIIPDPAKLYNLFKRIHIEILPELSNDVLSDRLNAHDQVLCIVNTRKQARLVFESIQDQEGCYHLSALMCPAHRTKKFKEIRSALSKGLPCRVVSTQLIEAGVDIDFPVVYRCASGIDSIAQAAGRCNREGKIPEGGKVYVFLSETGLPPGHFRHTAETAEAVIRHHDDPLSLEAVKEYFRTLYWMRGELLDEYQILDDLNEGKRKGDFPFRVVDKKFKIIKDDMESIIIPWKKNEQDKDAEKIIQGLRYAEYPARFARKAQRFTIQVPPRVLSSLEYAGSVERLHDQYCVLINMDLYRDDLGLCSEDPTFYRPESLIG